jgi:hypothetical protein
MSITINGSGTITGLTTGGLPDGSITTDDLAAGAITNAKVNDSAAIADSKLTGTTCKTWVNFNGTGTPAIRASNNVSSITDNSTGIYTVNFTNALSDANYAISATNGRGAGNVGNSFLIEAPHNANPSTTAVKCLVFDVNGSITDGVYISIAIFR